MAFELRSITCVGNIVCMKLLGLIYITIFCEVQHKA